MSPEPFAPFGWLHLITVTLVLAPIVGFTYWGRRVGVERAAVGARLLGAVLFFGYFVEGFVRLRYLDMPPAHFFPGELCNALFFIGAFALWTRHRVGLEVLVLWALAGTLHSLITPTPLVGWPSVEYVRFFFSHGLLIFAAVYAVVALDAEITWSSVLRAAIALQLWELFIALVDYLFDQNFMFLCRKPPSPTLFDLLGPWPVYLIGAELIGIASFLVWVLLLRGVRKLLPRRPSAATVDSSDPP